MVRERELCRCRFVVSLYSNPGYIQDIAVVPRISNMAFKCRRCPSGCKNTIIVRLFSVFMKEQRDNRLTFSLNRYICTAMHILLQPNIFYHRLDV